MDGVLSDASGRQHLPRAPAPRLGRVLRGRAARTPLIDEVARLLDLLDPSLRIVLLTARPIRVQRQTLGVARSATSSAGTCSSCATGATTAPPATSSSDAVARAAAARLRPAPRLRGRPPQRRHVPPRGRALRLHPLRLLRLIDHGRSVSMAIARNGDVELHYETFGEPGIRPCCWSTARHAVHQLRGRVVRDVRRPRASSVVRFDNRDVGLSLASSTGDAATRWPTWRATRSPCSTPSASSGPT